MRGLTGLYVSAHAAVCRGCGGCGKYAPEILDQDERDGTVVVVVSRPTDASWPAVRTVAKRYPTQAVTIAHLGQE